MLACVVLELGTIIYTVLTFCSLRHYRVTQLKEHEGDEGSCPARVLRSFEQVLGKQAL